MGVWVRIARVDRRLLAAAVAGGPACLVSATLAACGGGSAASTDCADALPNFQLEDQERRQWGRQHLVGRSGVLLFLCGCPPCRTLMTRAQSAVADWGGVQVLAFIYADQELKRELLADSGLSCPVLDDPFGEFRAQVGASQCPSVMVSDPSGCVTLRLSQAECSDADTRGRPHRAGVESGAGEAMTHSPATESGRPFERWRDCLTRANLLRLGLWTVCFWLGTQLPWWHPETFGPLLQSVARPDWSAEAAKADPAIGQTISVPPLAKLEGGTTHFNPGGKQLCVMFIWECSACGLAERLRSWQTLADAAPAARFSVVVLRGDPTEVRRLWKDLGLRVPVYLDRAGRAARSLNAKVPGRVYVFDSDGKLEYVSGPLEKWKSIQDRLRTLPSVSRTM